MINKLREWFSVQWRKEYRGWLLLIGLVSFLVWLLMRFSFQALILTETALIIFWYTRETFDLKQISNKQIKEMRKQVFLEQRPFIRLQWINKTEDQFSGIRIINEGSGGAVNLKIKSGGKPTIRRTIVAGERASKSYTDAGYEDAGFADDATFDRVFSPVSNNYKMEVVYFDIVGNEYLQKFTTDKLLNDKFELKEWDMPEDFKKIKFKKICSTPKKE